LKLVSFAIAAGLAAAFAAPACAADIVGAGATFPFPVYAKWAEAYYKETGNRMNYQSIGSGGGIKQIEAKTVDFGATDAPLKGEDLRKHGLVQFPSVMGGVVPIVNIPGIVSGQLKLSGPVLADIFQGRITKWIDPRIAELNAGLTLPDATITTINRSDASGTTNVFTTYLSQVSDAWRATLGAATSITWPTGQGGKGNEGVSALVKQVPNAIGYVEYAYAKQNSIPFAQLRNKDGTFVSPDSTTFQAAAAGADWTSAPGFGISLTDQPGAEAWPITAPTFILVHKDPAKPDQTAEVLKFFVWAYRNGGEMATGLDYVALPGTVTDMIRRTWAEEIKTSGGQAVY
jgi:phosphate transport system substrate-binding protein